MKDGYLAAVAARSMRARRRGLLLGAVAGLELVASFAVLLTPLPLAAPVAAADVDVDAAADDVEPHALSGKYTGRT